MYKALYRAYRPEVFDDMLGQEHIVTILKNQIAAGSVNHAYLFCGTRGTGKTTVARLVAKAVNCESDGEKPCGKCGPCQKIKQGSFMDLIEIDAASNNGVDNIRELRESVKYPPVEGRCKVYIIDEVHMLSTQAYNALLKTLEEPPENVIFILCTTEPEKLPATILSRCMRMDFRRVKEDLLADRVRKICIDRGVLLEESAVRVIVAAADGSARDCLTLLDRCISGRKGNITKEEVLEALGTVGEDVYVELTEKVNDHDVSGGLVLIDGLLQQGKDPRQILQGWMAHYRNLLMTKFVEHPENVLSMSVENIQRIARQAELTPLGRIEDAIIRMAKAVSDIKVSNQPRILLEICFVQLATTTDDGRVINVGSRMPEGQRRSSAAGKYAEAASMAKEAPAAEPAQPAEQIGIAAAAAAKPAAEETPAPESGAGTAEAEDIPAQQAGAETAADAYGEGYESDGDDDIMMAMWTDILEDGKSQTDTFTIVRTGAVPIKMNDSEIVLKVSGLAERYLERNRIPMEYLIEKYAGSHLHMILKREGRDETDVYGTASKLESILGTEVSVKQSR